MPFCKPHNQTTNQRTNDGTNEQAGTTKQNGGPARTTREQTRKPKQGGREGCKATYSDDVLEGLVHDAAVAALVAVRARAVHLAQAAKTRTRRGAHRSHVSRGETMGGAERDRPTGRQADSWGRAVR